MSKEAVKEFLQKVRSDKALQDQLQAAAQGESDPIGHIVEAARKLGFDFSAQEFMQAEEEIQGRLTHEQLKGVAGGVKGHHDFLR